MSLVLCLCILLLTTATELSTETIPSFITELSTETAVGMALAQNHREAVKRFCNENGRFEVKNPDKTHKIRMEFVIKSGENSVVCQARSTKMGKPKGEPYAVKISFDDVKEEAAILAQMQTIPDIIRCRWGCKAVYVKIPTRTITLDAQSRKFTYQALALEYFPGDSLREYLRLLASPVLPKKPAANRERLLYYTEVRRAYRKAIDAAMNMWKAGWVHNNLHTGNIMYSPIRAQMKIIDVLHAKNWHQVSLGMYLNWDTQEKVLDVSFMEWMAHVCNDYQYIAFTFGLTLICPEEFTPADPRLQPHERHTDARGCVNFEEVEEIMKKYDPELVKILRFMETPVEDRKIIDLPTALQEVARTIMNHKKKTPSEYSDSPPTYAEVADQSWALTRDLGSIAAAARADAFPPSAAEPPGSAASNPPGGFSLLPKSMGKRRMGPQDSQANLPVLQERPAISEDVSGAGSSAFHAAITATGSSSDLANTAYAYPSNSGFHRARENIYASTSSRAEDFPQLRHVDRPVTPPISSPRSLREPPEEVPGTPRVHQLVDHFDVIADGPGASGPSPPIIPDVRTPPGMTYIVSSTRNVTNKSTEMLLAMIFFTISIFALLRQNFSHNSNSLASALITEEEI